MLRAKKIEEEFNSLAEENRAFILRCAGRTLHRFIDESDEAWSVALLAFYEAVRSYETGSGGFHAFAALVIKRRLQDHLQTEYRRKPEISVGTEVLEETAEEESTALQSEVQKKIAEHSAGTEPGTTPLQDEITALEDTLGEYGFTFFDLAAASPKAQKTRKKCAAAVRAVLQRPELVQRMRTSGQLPVREIAAGSGTPVKTIEKHRRYIIAAVEILDGDYPQLSEYMRSVRDGS